MFSVTLFILKPFLWRNEIYLRHHHSLFLDSSLPGSLDRREADLEVDHCSSSEWQPHVQDDRWWGLGGAHSPQDYLSSFDMTSWIQLLVQCEAVANRISLTAPVLFAAWIWSMVWSTPVSINTSYTVDIYVPLMENFPFLPVVPLTSSLCSGPLENSTVKLPGSKCQALWLVCIFQ